MISGPKKTPHPAVWVPSLYLAEGIPFSVATLVAATMFKDFGHTDGEITSALGWVLVVWSLKPLWAAFMDMIATKRLWVLTMQFTLAGLILGLSLALSFGNYFQIIIAIIWVLAFCSATQDIAADGIYLTSLNKVNQSRFVGVQGVFWNLGKLVVIAGIVWFSGYLQDNHGLDPKTAWAYAIGLGVIVMGTISIYHLFVLPTGSIGVRPKSPREVMGTFFESIVAFFKKDKIWGMLAFVFLFRSSEGLLLGVGHLFLQAPIEDGGIGLSLQQKGAIDGGISTVVSLAGGLLGGLFISKYGLKRSLFFMAICVNVPNLCFVYLSQVTGPDSPVSLTTVATLVTFEKFGYSFGFVSNMLYMMQQISPGKFHMTHYAFCTAIMNAFLAPLNWVSGRLSDSFGYETFFIIVCVAAIPSFIAAYFAPFPRDEKADQAAETAT